MGLGVDHWADPAALARWAPAGKSSPLSGMDMLSDWIAARLYGVLATEPSCGSSSGMLSLVDRTWSTEIARICSTDASVLPGTVTRHAAEATRLREETPVVSGDADTQLRAARSRRPAERVHGCRWHFLAEHDALRPAAGLRRRAEVQPITGIAAVAEQHACTRFEGAPAAVVPARPTAN